MADRWTWTPEEWARIERVARAERHNRMWSRTDDCGAIGRRASRATADGAAMELRQWARVAGCMQPDASRDVRRCSQLPERMLEMPQI